LLIGSNSSPVMETCHLNTFEDSKKKVSNRLFQQLNVETRKTLKM